MFEIRGESSAYLSLNRKGLLHPGTANLDDAEWILCDLRCATIGFSGRRLINVTAPELRVLALLIERLCHKGEHFSFGNTEDDFRLVCTMSKSGSYRCNVTINGSDDEVFSYSIRAIAPTTLSTAVTALLSLARQDEHKSAL
jgi:hypothetical protein